MTPWTPERHQQVKDKLSLPVLSTRFLKDQLRDALAEIERHRPAARDVAVGGETVTYKGWENWTPPTACAPTSAPKGNKYHAQRVEMDGHWFDSKREARRYQQLKSMQLAGQIKNLELQPRYALHAWAGGGRKLLVGDYIPDFRYWLEGTGTVVEDVKSPATRTPLYQWKKKHLDAEYGIEIIEV